MYIYIPWYIYTYLGVCIYTYLDMYLYISPTSFSL